jgi:hypothetical protein
VDKAKARPGICPRRPKHAVVTINAGVPQLERGSGRNNIIVQTAECGFSKEWRKENKTLIDKFSHLIDKKVKKPDISAFLTRYPVQESDSEDEGDEDEDPRGGDDMEQPGHEARNVERAESGANEESEGEYDEDMGPVVVGNVITDNSKLFCSVCYVF